jgi:hypothetical protein
MIVRIGLALYCLVSVSCSANAAFVCSEAKPALTKDPELRNIAEKAYGPLQYRDWSETKPCAVPTAVLKYKNQMVLISTAEPPYQGHACQATLTAHVFAPAGDGLKLSRTVRDFVQTGENCLAGAFKPISIAGQDAFAVEGSGGGQGAQAGWLEFYRFDGDTIRQAKLPNLSCVWVDYRNAGPASADLETIRSTWRIGGASNNTLYLDFKVSKPKARTKTLKTEWSFGPGGLTLVRGNTPEAFADGACL